MRVWRKNSPTSSSQFRVVAPNRRAWPMIVALVLAMPAGLRGADSGESLSFSNAVMFTPARTNTETRLFRFAPLLVFETSAINLADWPLSSRFGAVGKAHGELRVNPRQPVVYARSDAVIVHGQLLERFSYLWWRPSALSNAMPVAQGVRITATPAGQSLVFEIVDTSIPACRFVVTKSLETAAQKAFGGPVAGRRFAVEKPVSGGVGVEILRVIEDGPLELGPVVYLRSGDRGIGTVICRCMPAQVRSIAATGYYELMGWNDAVSRLLEEAGQQNLDHSPLDRIMRLPENLPGAMAAP